MSQSVSRVIGIIRVTESREPGLDWTADADDSTLESLLAGLAGKRAPQRALSRGCRFERAAPVPRRGKRRVIPANLKALRDDLERQYVALAAG